MTVDEIMNGSTCGAFAGLVPIVRSWLATQGLSTETAEMLDRYLTLVSRRASGDLMTCARFMRSFVHGHASYRGDGRVSSEVSYDLLELCRRIGEGEVNPPELMGSLHIPKVTSNVCGGALVTKCTLNPSVEAPAQ
jgi:glutamate--cysteine ligase catalytic subunit